MGQGVDPVKDCDDGAFVNGDFHRISFKVVADPQGEAGGERSVICFVFSGNYGLYASQILQYNKADMLGDF